MYLQPETDALWRALKRGETALHCTQLRPQRKEQWCTAHIEEDNSAFIAAGDGGNARKQIRPPVGNGIKEIVAFGDEILERGVNRRDEGLVPSALV